MMNMLDDVKFAMGAGKEISIKEIGKEIHVSCKGVFHFILEKDDVEAKEIISLVNPSNDLTEKESIVFKSAFENTLEFGLPVSVDEIKRDTKLSKRTIVGVVGSLFKKGLLEDYDFDSKLENEFMVSEKGFEFMGEEVEY